MPKAQSISQLDSTASSAHVIRLHGPWQYKPLALTQWGPNGESVDLPGDLPPAGSVTIPSDWTASLGSDFRGRVLYERRFGRPSNLELIERIDLVLQNINGHASITLNGGRLGATDTGATETGGRAYRFELTNRLLPRNVLQIEVNLPRGSENVEAGGIVGQVHLEIYGPQR